MTNKEKVLQALNELGFQTELVEDFGYSFTYEGKNFMYLPNDEDENFLSISIPGIYDLEDGNLATFIALIEKINYSAKYVKAYKLGDSVWLFYERELMGDEDFNDLVSRMIMRLDATLFMSRQMLAHIEAEMDGENDEESNDETE